LDGDCEILFEVLEVLGFLRHLISEEIILSLEVKDLLRPVLLLEILQLAISYLELLPHLLLISLAVFHVGCSNFKLGLVFRVLLLSLSNFPTELLNRLHLALDDSLLLLDYSLELCDLSFQASLLRMQLRDDLVLVLHLPL
jgi:hypothetical protein